MQSHRCPEVIPVNCGNMLHMYVVIRIKNIRSETKCLSQREAFLRHCYCPRDRKFSTRDSVVPAVLPCTCNKDFIKFMNQSTRNYPPPSYPDLMYVVLLFISIAEY